MKLVREICTQIPTCKQEHEEVEHEDRESPGMEEMRYIASCLGVRIDDPVMERFTDVG